MAGTIDAKGGASGGNGGFVEVSGNTGFSLTGMVDVSAPMGVTGTILLDPLDLDIVAAGADDEAAGSTGVDVGSPDQATSITVTGSVLTALAGNLQIEASRNLTIDTPLVFTNQTVGSTVQFLAGNNLTVNQSVSTAGGSLSLAAAVATDGSTAFANFNPAGVLTINAAVGDASTGNIQLTGGTGGIALAGNLQVAASDSITLSTTGGITQTAGGILASPLLVVSTGSASLTGANTVTQLAAQLSGAGSSLTFNNAAAALAVGTVSGVSGITTNAGDVSLTTTTSGGIALNQSIAAAGNTVTIDLAGTLSQVAGSSITAAALASAGVAGNVSLLGTANAISNLDAFTATTGNIAINDSVALGIAGNVTATTGNVYLANSSAAGITFGAFTVASVAGGTVGLQTNALANLGVTGATGQANAGATGTFELAPNTANPVTLGKATGLSLTNMTGITAGTLRIGAVTQPGSASPTIIANAIGVTGAFDLGGADLDLQTSGAITQTAALTTVGRLTGTAASATLNQANAISNLGSFAATDGDFLLADGGLAGSFTVSGPVTGSNVTISGATALNVTGSIGAIGTVTLNDVGIALGNGAIVTGPLVQLIGGAGGIAMAGNSAIGSTTGTVDITSAAGMTEAATSVITAGTLLSSGAPVGSYSLRGIGNAVANVGNFAVGGSGNFDLADASALTVAGTVSVAGTSSQVYLQSSNAGGITIGAGGAVTAPGGSSLASFRTDAFGVTGGGSVSGAIFELAPNTTGSTVTLGASGGGLSLTSMTGITTGNIRIGAVTLPGGGTPTTAGALNVGGTFATGATNLILDASGAVTQAAPLVGNGHLSGTAASYVLMNTANAFSQINGLTATGGNIQLFDAAAALLGSVSATGNIYFADPTTSVGLGTALSAGGTVGLQADNLTVAPLATIAAPTFELAPLTPGTAMTLGSTGGLSLASLSGISATSVRLGAVTVPLSGLQTTAGSISIGGNFGSGGVALQLDTLGTISELGASALTASTLTGNAVTGVNLGNANAINNLGSFNVSAGTLTLADGGIAGNLSVGGPVTASSIAISGAPGITVGGSVGATSTVSLASGAGGIALGTGAIVTGATIDLNGAAGGIALAGNAILGTIGAIVDLTTTGVGVTEAGVSGITAGTLRSTGGISGSANLPLGDNNIFNLGSIAVGGSGSFALNDNGHSGALDVIGPVTADTGAGTVSITGSPTLVVVGSIGAASTIALTGGTLDFGTGALIAGPTIDLSAGPGGIALTGNASVGNSGAIVDLTTTGGGVAEAATAVIAAGTLQSTGGIGGAVNLLGVGNAVANVGSLAVAGGAFDLIDTGNLGVGGKLTASSITIDDGSGLLTVSNSLIATSAISLTAGNIAISGLVSDGGTGTTALFANLGAISETGTLIAGTLSGSAATAATLTGASATTNQVATVANFNAAGFTLDDGKSLNVTGALSGGPSATVLDTGTLTIAAGGTVTAAAIGLTGGDIAIPGLVTDGGAGTTSLVANTGTIGETGTLVSGTLSGSAVGAASLTGTTAVTNHVAALGNFTAGAFTLNDGSPLIVAGTLSAAPSATILDSGNLTVSGSIVSTNSVNLTASSIAISGFLADSFGTTTLIANAGSIDETGTLVVGTLTGSATGAANFSGAAPGTNTIVHLGSFTASPFTLDDGVALSVAGPVVSGSSITITDEGFLADVPSLSVTGTIAAPAVSLTADSMAIAGEVTDGGAGTVALIATSGTIGETGTLIAGTLTGSSTGGTSLTGATATTNKVAVRRQLPAPPASHLTMALV